MHNLEADSLFLKEKGLKITRVRLEVLKTLRKQDTLLSAEEIYKKLPKKTCDRATLFRTLKSFLSAGLVQMVDMLEGFHRYCLSLEEACHGHHVMCTICKKIEHLHGCVPKQFEEKLSLKGYQNIQHRMDFFGVCPSCTA